MQGKDNPAPHPELTLAYCGRNLVWYGKIM